MCYTFHITDKSNRREEALNSSELRFRAESVDDTIAFLISFNTERKIYRNGETPTHGLCDVSHPSNFAAYQHLDFYSSTGDRSAGQPNTCETHCWRRTKSFSGIARP